MTPFNLTDNSQRRAITLCMQNLVGLKILISVEGVMDQKFDFCLWDHSLLEEFRAMLPTLRRVYLSLWNKNRVWVLETSSWPHEMRWSEYSLPEFTRWHMVTDWYMDVHRQAYLV